MRVLCVNDLPPGPGGGGTEIHLDLLLAGLRAGGHDATAFDAGTARRVLAKVWNRPAAEALHAEIDRIRPDLLHFHNVARELSASVLAVRPDLPRLMTAHDGRLIGDADGAGPALRLGQRLRSGLDRRVARRHVPLVLAVSEDLRRRYEAAGLPAQLAWPWAAPPTTDLIPAETCRDLAFVGRLDRDKGVDVLVEAFLAAGPSDARLLLAGTGSYRPPHDPRVRVLGQLGRHEVSELLAGVRGVALGSVPQRRPEGAPLALVEALVHGRPLLVSDDPGCRELARIDGSRPAGLMAAAGDRAAWTQQIRRLLDDDELAAQLGAAARRAATDHTPEAGLARVERAYRQVLR